MSDILSTHTSQLQRRFVKGRYQELQKSVSFEYLFSLNKIKGIRSVEIIYDKKQIGGFSTNLFSVLFLLTVNMNYQGWKSATELVHSLPANKIKRNRK